MGPAGAGLLTLPYTGTVSNASAAMGITNTGDGAALEGTSNSVASNIAAVRGMVSSTSPGGFSAAVRGMSNGTGGLGIGVWGSQNGSGWGVYGVTPSGIGIYGNSTSTGVGVYANSTSGTGLFASSTNGTAATAQINNNNNTSNALLVSTIGTGNALVAQHDGSSGNLAVFKAGGSNVARIDRTGQGIFNGGIATSGADLAERVPTSGPLPQIGDVVEIDPNQPDRFRISTEANSTRVAGIISTEPGVTLNSRADEDSKKAAPALALVGRVPVKVVAENGAIRIGHLLVASSTPGHAMRAPKHPEAGTVIGKAMEKLETSRGTIEALVMLR